MGDLSSTVDLGMMRHPHRIILKTFKINPPYAVQAEQDFTG
jgi:hypothetical protein